MGPDRRAALEALNAVDRGRRLDLAFGDATVGLSGDQRRWAREAAFGAVRLRGRLDHLLAQHVRQSLDRMDPPVLNVLRLGAYQLFYMDSVPAYAAISQSVELARTAGFGRAAGLVNAVLRGLQREGGGPERFPSLADDPVGHLSTWGSHPAWLVERWLKRWGPEEVAGLVEENNRVPPLCLRALDGAEGLEAALEALTAAGVAVAAIHEGAGVIELAQGASLDAALGAVRAQVQDPGAALVVKAVEPPEIGLVADLCAAPGGKAMGLAAPGRPVVAGDPSRPRLAQVAENADRLGVEVWPVLARAQEPPVREAQVLLLDVPCSGTGTLRRHPDGRWRLEEAQVATLVGLQRDILEGSCGIVAQEGLLVYSTCTLEPEENEVQVRGFLDRHPEFTLEPPMGVPGEYMDAEGFLRVEPQVHGFDGAFAARMRRTG